MHKKCLLKSMTGEYLILQPHQKISLSRNMVFKTVEIFMAVFIEKLAYEFFEEQHYKDLNYPRKLVLLREILW